MISFVMRCRDEEKTLGESLESLKLIEVEHEIILILDRCKDRSEEIALASGNPNLKILRHSIPVSRAGVETLITNANSIHSLPTYVSDCFGYARYPWKFHFSADMAMTPELARFINRGWFQSIKNSTRIRLACVSEEDGTRNCEEYLSNCLFGFGKWVFWELPNFAGGALEIDLSNELSIRSLSSLKDLKPYWREPPWFETSDTYEAQTLRTRLAAVRSLIGPEPIGAARGSNPECDPIYRRVLENEQQLAAVGVHFRK